MMSSRKTLRIGIVAGEASGDILGAGLIHALREAGYELDVSGIGGPLMIAEGCHSFFAQDRLAVMGLVEPLKRLPELLRMRRFLRAHFIQNPPDIFIGVDSPDFNLSLEESLHQCGIKTVHYVSPSVWAWRQGRLKKIAAAADLVLTLFPFEEKFYREHADAYPALRAVCVGHPLADSIAMEPDMAKARHSLALDTSAKVVALLPGSRSGEVARMGKLFLDVANWCINKQADLLFVMPAANAARELQLRTILADYPGLPVCLVNGQSHVCMEASDAVLMASGTTTLEAMLLKKPMVVAYKMARLSYAIISRLLKVPFIALPNLLANEKLVPELLQDQATVENLGNALLSMVNDKRRTEELRDRFAGLHRDLQRDANHSAAKAVLSLLGAR
ncbi:MAG TPA: lipid-A-disaccharide synthase [Pseudomonadales bacterium]|nr:lipid-A-disaccharide synthase [Pseudomonadales bacterium]